MKFFVPFALYSVAGLAELWLLLVGWGMSAGPATPFPYYGLLGCLVLVLVASPLSLYLDRLGSISAVVGGALAVLWPAPILFQRDPEWISAAVICVPPLASLVHGLTRLVRSRGTPWLRLAHGPRLVYRLLVTAVQLVLFATVFNVGAVLVLVVHGPPHR